MGTLIFEDYIQSDSYCELFETGTDKFLKQANKTLKDIEFDTVIGRGLSGALFIPVLARAMDKNYFIVRKPGESSHAEGVAGEGRIGRKWLFVDDFIFTGATLGAVENAVYDYCSEWSWVTQYVGSYEYIYNRLTASPCTDEIENYV